MLDRGAHRFGPCAERRGFIQALGTKPQAPRQRLGQRFQGSLMGL